MKKLVLGSLAANCYILTTGKANIIIDAGAEPDKIKKYLSDENITPDFLLNTHGHYDHIGAVEEVISSYKIPFYIHKADEPLILDKTKNFSSFSEEKGLILKTYNLIDDKDFRNFDEYGLQIILTPGHTPGSISIIYEDMIFTGDILFRGTVGRTDLPGGSNTLLKRSLALIKRLNPELKVLPGHGKSTTLSYELKNNYFLSDDFLRGVD